MKIEYLADEFKEDFLNKPSTVYNSYYCTYKVVFIRRTNIPEFNSFTYSEKPIHFLSKSKCKIIKMPISDAEFPVAWYKGTHGFYPLYFREFEETEEILKKINRRY